MHIRRLSILPLLATILVCTVFAQRPPGGARPPVSGPRGIVPPAVGSPGEHPVYHHADDEARVEFRSETVLVQVPAVVTDKAGQHVHSLTKDDFQIYENGKEQKLTVLEEVNATRASVAADSKPGVFTNVLPDRDKPRALTIIALDTVNTPYLDQSYARRELIKYLANNIDTGQTLALVLITSKGLKVVHGLTSSAATLQEELKKASGEIPAMQTTDPDVEAAAYSEDVSNLFAPITAAETQVAVNNFIIRGDIDYTKFQQEAAIETTMQAFLGIAWSLGGVPGRKTLLWATGSFPFYVDSPAAVPAGRLAILYERAMQAMNEAGVSVYPVDVRGLLSNVPDVSTNKIRAGAVALQSVSNRAWLADAKQDALKDFAEMTGGKAFYNTNDLAGAFQRATEDGASYYLLGYYLDTKNTKAGWRQLKVKLKQKDFEIRVRKGFFVTNATMNPDATRVVDMNYAIGAPFEATGIPFEMKWGAMKESPGTPKKQVNFSIHVMGDAITFDSANNSIDLAVVAVATKPASKKDGTGATIAANLSQDIKGNLTPEKQSIVKNHGVAWNNALALEPGQYSVRFVIRDNFSGRLGSLSVPVTVN
jgi:VWFA-related protein